MISWQTAAHWPYVEVPFPFYLVFYDRGRVPGCGGRRGVGRAAGGWAEAHGGGPGETHGGVIITCLQNCRNCFRVILSGDNRVKKY